MRTERVPLAVLLLVLACTVLQVSSTSTGDIYWEGEEDGANEFLEVKEDEPGIIDTIKRIKRQFDWGPLNFFGTKEDEAEGVTDSSDPDDSAGYGKDDDQDNFGSGIPDKIEPEPREKTLRVTFLVMEPYIPAYSNRDSPEFLNISRSLANAVDLLFETLPGTQRSSLVRIQSLVNDDFLCKVTLDIVTTGYEDTDNIKDILRNHIKNNGRLGETSVHDGDFSAQLIDPANLPDQESQNPDDYDTNSNVGGQGSKWPYGQNPDENPDDQNQVTPDSQNPDNEDTYAQNPDDQNPNGQTPDDRTRYEQTNPIPYTPTSDSDSRVPEQTNDWYLNNQTDTSPNVYDPDRNSYEPQTDDDTQDPEQTDDRDNETDASPNPSDNPQDVQAQTEIYPVTTTSKPPSSNWFPDFGWSIPRGDIDDAESSATDVPEEKPETPVTPEYDELEVTTRKTYPLDEGTREKYPDVTRTSEQPIDSDVTTRKTYPDYQPNYDCPPDHMRCDDTRCVQLIKRCDRVSDCDDGADEAGCPEVTCGADDFHCSNGNCIESSRRCNRVYDCPGQEDERDCDCRPDEFRCQSDGACIEERKKCDRVTHCADGSDEQDCVSKLVSWAGHHVCQDPGRFRCHDGSCISILLRCDGFKDCKKDGSDEIGCPCSSDQWQCDHGSCIRRSKRCDGRVDCPTDRSDERNCIANGYFKCRSGKVIPKSLWCNRQYDCTPGDFSDEQNCPCGANDFRCDNGHCIPASKHCDRTHDCQDGSDERGCTYGTVCMAYEYECTSGMCVRADAKCNGTLECDDGTDESSCPCKRDQYPCHDGSCINIAFLCNGRKDCSQGEDEYNCRSSCPPEQFPCKAGSTVACATKCDERFECDDGEDEEDCEACAHRCAGTCISASKICDRIPDCPDNSDEDDCDFCDGADDFRCESGDCIGFTLSCNGNKDCPDGSDEANCNNTIHASDQLCSPNEFLCTTDQVCIESKFLCDNNKDCIDGSDEANCPWYMTRASRSPAMAACHESEFTCYDGRCIPHLRRCDNIYDCFDFSDEQNCYNTACPDDSWQCRSGECIPTSEYCDGIKQCQDGTDENGNCPTTPAIPVTPDFPSTTSERYPSGGQNNYGGCSRQQWRCENGPCIEAFRRCDGHIDCPLDYSDEFDCPSNSAPALSLKTYPAEQSVRNGGDVVFQCRDEGPLRANVRWQRDGRPIKQGSTDVRGRLEMYKVTESDSGDYICQAEDYRGYPGAQIRVNLQVERAPVTSRPPFPACQPYEATCGNGQCIPKSAVCDNKYDCNDRTDEENCHHDGMCEPNQFKCNNGKCVLKTWICDFDDDCGDGSDEQSCDHKGQGQCLAVEYTCQSGDQCIPKSFHCDGQTDCIDGTDEIGCTPVHVTRPPKPSNVKLNPGDTLTLSCGAVGVPVPVISWRLNWGHVPTKCVWTNNKGDSVITCNDMQPEDSGAYSCEALNNKGTTFATPDAIVFVAKTDPCPRGYFNNEARSESECIRCFCFGKSSQCRSADLFTYNMPTPLGEGGTRLIGIKQSPTGDVTIDTQPISNQFYYQGLRNGATVTKFGDVSPWSSSHPYLTLPESYNGNQLKSYGGHIKYTVSPQTQPYGNEDSYNLPTIIIKGKYGNLFHISRAGNARDINIEARLTPEDWKKSSPSGFAPASREDIMMTLDEIEMILLRADLYNAGVNITDFAMESAEHINVGLGAASLVEECTCPKEYVGLSCQKCASGFIRKKVGPWLGDCVPEECPPGTYGDPSSGTPCKQCPCPLTNRENQFARTCSLGPDGTVICDCFPGYEGQHCEICAPGYEGNPLVPGNSCKPTPVDNCNPTGTKVIRPPDECVCKDNVQGRYCDQCKNDSFYLSSDSRHGCALCFCSGVSQQCMSSNLRRKTISVQFNVPQIVDQVKIYNSSPAGPVGSVRYTVPVETDLRPQLNQGDILLNDVDHSRATVYYWSLPTSFAGDKVTSYGGYLRYTLKNVPSSNDPRFKNTAADVQLISDNRLSFHYFGDFAPSHDGILNASVQFLEKGWQRPDGKEVSREHFLLALADVKTILIKATYTPNTQLASPVGASIETAEADGYGPTAFHVEQCVCPPGYIGTSCEDCAPGYTRSLSGLYLEHCERCDCNGKSTMCNPETGVCYNCADNTDGENCELCKPGFDRDPYGNCVEYSVSTIQPCRCDPRGTTAPCSASGDCYCKQNVEGDSCDRCRAGTFGLDTSNADGCLSCYCSGVTSDCHEGNHYTRIPMAAPVLGEDYGGFSITDLNAERVIKDNFVPLFQQSELMYTFSFRPEVELYWSLPNFPGNRVLSYGGSISLRQKFSSDVYEKSERGTDVVLDGGDISIFWTNPNQFPSGVAYSYQVPLKEDGWYILNTNTQATRSNFMSVLRNLKRVLVRATVVPNVYDTSIADVSMDTATQNYDAVLPAAKGIEICMCPPGYTGTSCEGCLPGYYKDQQGYCRQCSCNGHDCQLDSYGQVVCNCQPPYTGYDCSTIAGDSSVTEPPTRPPPPEPTVVVRITSPTIKISEVGSSVNFTCQAQSRNSRIRLPVRWAKSNGNLPLGRSQVDEQVGLLLITNLEVSDSGKYICETSDGINTAQAIATLKVPGNEMTLPTVEISPSMMEYYEGDRIELECRVRGNPTPTIRWQRGNSRPLPLTAENIETLLIIESARLEDSGEYRCIASNTAGSDDRTAVVTVRQRPSWQPRDKLTVSIPSPSVAEGNSIRIACTGTTNIPAGSIDWVRQDNAIFSPNVRSDNGVLYIDNATPDNQGVYICQSPLSDVSPVPVLVTVIANPIPEVYNITVSVDQLTLPTGGTGTVDCNPVGRPAPLIKWTKHGGSLGRDSSQRGNTLIINNAQESDRGYYMCEGSVNNVAIANIYVYVEIERREPPTVEIWPHGEQAVPLGGQHELMCRVLGGIPEPDVTWNRNGGRPLSSFTQIQPQNVLKFNKIEVNDEGEYTCTARNDAGTASASAVIKVRSPPEITISPTTYLQVSNGEPINIECRANGYPEPMVSIQSGDYREVVPSTPGYAALRVASASTRDNGYYTCTATSVAGTITDQFAIIVNRGDGGNDGGDDGGFPDEGGSGEGEVYPVTNPGEPQETPKNLVAIEGQPEVIIDCSQSGAKVKWDRADRQPLQRNALQEDTRLIIFNVSKSDSGQYVCNIFDEYNEYSDVRDAIYTSLVVITAPKITLRPPTQTVHPGQSPTVECIVDGDDIIDVTWRPFNRVNSNRVDTRSSTLIFHQIEVEDAGRYECIARSLYANASAFAEVVVSDDSDRTASVSHDNEQHAHVGAAVHLSCNVSQPNVRIVWTKNGRGLPRSVKQKSDGSLFIGLAQKSDSGKYVCNIRNNYGELITSNYINLHIQGFECLETEFRCYDYSGCVDEHLLCDGHRHCPDNSDEENCLWRDKRYSDNWNNYLTHDGPRDPNPESQQLVSINQSPSRYRVGDNVDVLCKRMSQDIKVQWVRPGTNQYVASHTYGDGVVLSLQGVTNADAGKYRCIGNDAQGRTSYEDFDLEVESGGPYYPDNRGVTVSEYTARLRDSVDLPCTHNLEQPVSIEWRREFSPLPAEVTSNQPILRLESVTEADAGTYVCRISNSRAAIEARAILTVTGVVPRFDGESFLSLPTLKDAYNQFEIEVSFKPNDKNGLILYNSQNQGREGDYIALELKDGVPEFVMNTGSEPLVVKGDRPLQLNAWHTIRLNRAKSKVTMDVDNTGPFISEAPGQWEVLELKQPLYIGGVPDYDQLPVGLAGASGFIGCASMLILGREEKNIMMDSLEQHRVSECNSCAPNLCLNSGVCQEARNELGYMCICTSGYAGRNCDRTGEACRPGICGHGKCSDTIDGYKCACPVTHTGRNCEVKQSIEYPAFTGSAYLAIRPPAAPSRTLRMSMNIKAAPPVTDGIIMYCAESPRGYGGFTSLAVHDSKLEFRFDLGGDAQPVVLVSNRTLPANEWTNVRIARVGSVVSLKINTVYSFEQKLESPQRYLNLDTPIFVGGVDDSITLNVNTGVTGGFNGCIKEFMLHGEAVDIINSTIQSANVQECNNYDRGDIPEMESVCQCRNGGACTTDPATCSCPPGFAGQLCEYRVPSSMRSSGQLPSDPCAARPCRNGGTCRPDLAVRMNHTCDCPLGFAGVYCQISLELYQSVGFNGNGYLELPASLLNYDHLETDPGIIAMAVHTMQDGVLLYQKEAQSPPDYGDYLLLRINRGFVIFEWDMGGGKSSLTVNVFVNDGERHQIIAKILEDGGASLSVDSTQNSGTSTGISNVMNADSNIYIGGIPDHINQLQYPGFNGCIEQIELMTSNRGLNLGQVAVAGRNTQRCKEPVRSP